MVISMTWFESYRCVIDASTTAMRLVEVDLSPLDHVTQPCVLPSDASQLWASTGVRNASTGLDPTDVPVDFFTLLFIIACVILICVIVLIVAVTCPPQCSAGAMKGAQDPQAQSRMTMRRHQVRRDYFIDEGESQEKCVFIEDTSESQEEETTDATLVNVIPCSSRSSTASKSTSTSTDSTTSRFSSPVGSQRINLPRSSSLDVPLYDAAVPDIRPHVKDSKWINAIGVDYDGEAQRNVFLTIPSVPTKKQGNENPRLPTDYADKVTQLQEYVAAQTARQREINPQVLFYQGESSSGTTVEDFDSLPVDILGTDSSRVYRLPSFSQSTINPVESCDEENSSQTPPSIALASRHSHWRQTRQCQLRKSLSGETLIYKPGLSLAEPDLLMRQETRNNRRGVVHCNGNCAVVAGSDKQPGGLHRPRLNSTGRNGQDLYLNQAQLQRNSNVPSRNCGGVSKTAQDNDSCARSHPNYVTSTFKEPQSQNGCSHSIEIGEAKHKPRGLGEIPSALDFFGLQRNSLPSHIKPRERYKLEADSLCDVYSNHKTERRATCCSSLAHPIQNGSLPHTRSERSMHNRVHLDLNYAGGSLDLHRKRHENGCSCYSLQYSGSLRGQARNSMSDKLVRQKYLLRSESPQEVNSQENVASSQALRSSQAFSQELRSSQASSQELRSGQASSQSLRSGQTAVSAQSQSLPVTHQPVARQPLASQSSSNDDDDYVDMTLPTVRYLFNSSRATQK
ncbi:hypothetical protein Btru_020131 [Bulinus truncatus]|nr:hypothetical protein Btru_020131 [Bulinus truncatus]